MTWFRSRNSQLEDFAEAIRPELEQLPTPAPHEELLEQILASRRSGARVILPEVSARRQRNRPQVWIPAALVAALLVVLLPFRWSSRPGSSSAEPSSLSRIANEWLPGSVAFAQTDASRVSRKAAPMSFTRPGKLRPMRLDYQRTWRDSVGHSIARLNGVTTVEQVMSNGTPAWLVVARNDGERNGQRLFAIDSVITARSDLRLMRHTVIERPYSKYAEIRVEQTFRGDSVVGSMHAHGDNVSPAWRPFARRLAAAQAPYIVDAVAPILLGAVNLVPGWSATASMIGWAVRNDDVFIPIELHLDGAETVTVPAGKFDCWRVSIRFANRSVTYWSRKSDGVGVRSLERDPQGITRDVVLVRQVSR